MRAKLDDQMPAGKDKQLVLLIRRGTVSFLVTLWTIGMLMAALLVWMLVDRAWRETESAVAALEQYAKRSIELSDFVADEYARFLDERGQLPLIRGDPVTSTELATLNGRLPAGSASIFALPDGTVAASSSKLPSPDVNLSDRRWFKAHMSEALDAYIGPAIHSRVIDQIIYTYSKVYRGSEGQILGIINLGIPSRSVIGLSATSANVAVALVQHEGPLVAAQPMRPERLGEAINFGAEPPEDSVTRLASMFGRLSVTSVKNLPEYRLHAVAAVPLLQTLEPALWSIGAGMVVLVLLTVLLLGASHVAEQKSREVEQALAHNRILFQEVHHRVKNNLQIISSLIRLQIDSMPPELRPVMERTANRVRSIAMVHEQIYSTSSPTVVELDQFLAKLLQQLTASLLNTGGTRLSLQLQPVSLSLDRAVPVALMATEAITNAMKHGTGPNGGNIEVSLFREGNQSTLRVTDDGIGFDPQSKAGLGTRIMNALADQVGGTYRIEPAEPRGTRFILTWPE
jgi:two-component sensor histidine kinase